LVPNYPITQFPIAQFVSGWMPSSYGTTAAVDNLSYVP
jgi:hypothetical protein